MTDEDVIGLRLKEHIHRVAWILKGYTNPKTEPLGLYEREECFPKMKEFFREKGRLRFCGCLHQCTARDAILSMIGLCVNLAIFLDENGYQTRYDNRNRLYGFRMHRHITMIDHCIQPRATNWQPCLHHLHLQILHVGHRRKSNGMEIQERPTTIESSRRTWNHISDFPTK